MTSIGEAGWRRTIATGSHENLPFYWWDWREDKLPQPLPPLQKKRNGPVTRELRRTSRRSMEIGEGNVDELFFR